MSVWSIHVWRTICVSKSRNSDTVNPAHFQKNTKHVDNKITLYSKTKRDDNKNTITYASIHQTWKLKRWLATRVSSKRNGLVFNWIRWNFNMIWIWRCYCSFTCIICSNMIHSNSNEKEKRMREVENKNKTMLFLIHSWTFYQITALRQWTIRQIVIFSYHLISSLAMLTQDRRKKRLKIQHHLLTLIHYLNENEILCTTAHKTHSRLHPCTHTPNDTI